MDGQPAVDACDRIGKGPCYNSAGDLIATNIEELHSDRARINKDMALTEKAEPVNGVGDTPNVHDILIGSRPDGTAFPSGDDVTCRNWTSSREGRAQVGHHDRRGLNVRARVTWLQPVGSRGDGWRRPVLLLRHRLTSLRGLRLDQG
jgi:hypothetical protein